MSGCPITDGHLVKGVTLRSFQGEDVEPVTCLSLQRSFTLSF
jgi:hypothetical protein